MLIRAELKSNGTLAAEDKKLWVHTNMTEVRLTAANDECEDVITYKQSIKQYGPEAGASVVVTGVDVRRNLLTVPEAGRRRGDIQPGQVPCRDRQSVRAARRTSRVCNRRAGPVHRIR